MTLSVTPGKDPQFSLVKDGEQGLAMPLHEQDFFVCCCRALDDAFVELVFLDESGGDVPPGNGDPGAHQKHIFPEISQMS